MASAADAPPHPLNLPARIKNATKSAEQQEKDLAQGRAQAGAKIKETSDNYQQQINSIRSEIANMNKTILAAKTNPALIPEARRKHVV